MCLVTASRACRVQRRLQKDIRSSPETAGQPACPGLPDSGFIAISPRPDDCVEPPGESASCSWDMLLHAWDSRGPPRLRFPGPPCSSSAPVHLLSFQ